MQVLERLLTSEHMLTCSEEGPEEFGRSLITKGRQQEGADVPAVDADRVRQVRETLDSQATAERMSWLFRVLGDPGRCRLNIIVSIAVKALFLMLAWLGLVTLWLVVLADTGTSLLVTPNGLRPTRR